MFDLGWTELLVIGIVALIVVGPKDLPVLFRKAGEFVGKMKGMAREFSKAMNDAADETGMRETASSLRKVADPKSMGLDSIKDAVKDAAKWDPESETGKLAAKREAERARMVEEANASAAETARQVREAHAARLAKEAEPAETAKKPAPRKPAPRKPAAKTPAAQKGPAKTGSKASATQTTAPKPAPKKATPKKTAAKKPAPDKA